MVSYLTVLLAASHVPIRRPFSRGTEFGLSASKSFSPIERVKSLSGSGPMTTPSFRSLLHVQLALVEPVASSQLSVSVDSSERMTSGGVLSPVSPVLETAQGHTCGGKGVGKPAFRKFAPASPEPGCLSLPAQTIGGADYAHILP